MSNPYGTLQAPTSTSVGTTANGTSVSPAGNWLSRTLMNTGATDATLGIYGVVAGTGPLLAAGKSVTIDNTKDAIYAITASGTTTIAAWGVI